MFSHSLITNSGSAIYIIYNYIYELYIPGDEEIGVEPCKAIYYLKVGQI